MTVEKQWVLFKHICDTKPNYTEKKTMETYYELHETT